MKNHKKVSPKESKTLKILETKYVSIISIILTMVFIFLNSAHLHYKWIKYQETASSEAIQLAKAMESLLPTEYIVELKGSDEDRNTPEYEEIKENLIRLVTITDSTRFAYLIKEKEEILLLVSSEPLDSKEYSTLENICAGEVDSIKKVFTSGETIITSPKKSYLGNWISVLVPVFDESTNQVIAVFGITYPTRDWNLNAWKKMIPEFIGVFFILLLYISFLYILTQHYRLTELNKKMAIDQALYRGVFEQAPIGIAIMQDKLHATNKGVTGMSINPAYEKIVGRSKKELEKLTWVDMTYPDDLEEDIKKFEQFKKGEISRYTVEKRYIKPDGSIVWANMNISALLGLDDDNSIHLCLIEDISSRKHAEETLKETERRENLIINHLPGLAYRCKNDEDGTMLIVSDGCYELTGYKPENFINNRDLSFSDIISSPYRKKLLKIWDEAIRNKLPYQYEYEITTATNQKKWVVELGEPLYDEDGTVEALEGIILDITARKKFESNLQYINEHDRLTGLYNSQHLEKVLKKDIKKGISEKKAIIGINLSTIQLLAANYGFQYTQNLIKKAAEVLSKYADNKKTLFTTHENRFIFYIKGYLDKEEIFNFSKKIGEALEDLFVMERITGEIAILEIDYEPNVDLDLIFKRLLIAAEKSQNVFEKSFKICFYDEKLEEGVNRERQIREELTEIAINNTAGKLYLEYQPVLDLKTNSICSFEALARIKTEELGYVPPLEFIPVAEKTKLIIDIGEEIVRIALRFLKKLNEEIDENMTVSINVSTIQLLIPDFSKRLFELIEDAKVRPENVGIEITESFFIADYDDINRIINGLRKKGLEVLIDDFGTGYSSLAREKELNVDCLKIDKYFIDKLFKGTFKKAITSDIISIAHKLGHYAVAEGVEHEEQLQYLKEHNCDRAQGYFISKPLNEELALKFPRNYKNK